MYKTTKGKKEVVSCTHLRSMPSTIVTKEYPELLFQVLSVMLMPHAHAQHMNMRNLKLVQGNIRKRLAQKPGTLIKLTIIRHMGSVF